jgi:hypothetical protein
VQYCPASRCSGWCHTAGHRLSSSWLSQPPSCGVLVIRTVGSGPAGTQHPAPSYRSIPP